VIDVGSTAENHSERIQTAIINHSMDPNEFQHKPIMTPPQNTFPLSMVPVYGEEGGYLPHALIEELGQGPLHRVEVTPPKYDLKGLGKRLEKKLIRTDSEWDSKGVFKCQSVLLRTRGGMFATCYHSSIRVYGRDWKATVNLAKRLHKMACSLARPRKPCYYLIERSCGCIGTETVALKGVRVPEAQELSLLYGEDFYGWHSGFLQRFEEKPSGLTILEGPPGTGKTTFLRYLMSHHAKTHCFYYIAPHEIGCLVDSDFISFWARQRELHQDKKLALIIEDAEQALMARANDNRSLVQVVLNYSDGMLADFLRLQIIATVNCRASDLDEALLRPGRLMARRHFGRLSRADARRLAAHHGLSLSGGPEDYSLAEIFNEQEETNSTENKILGFAA
jgi:hypothetical protein